MTNAQHTPGPWTYHHEPTLNRHVVRAGFAGERNICSSFGAGLTSYESAANARLIAASPKLLAACQRALAEAVADDQDEWFADMRAAVTEAAGK